MKFGIFYEHQLPRPWAEDSEQQLINDALEQVELADKLGFDVVWEVEHHFLEEYSHSSAPEVLASSASGRPTSGWATHRAEAPLLTTPSRRAHRMLASFQRPRRVRHVDVVGESSSAGSASTDAKGNVQKARGGGACRPVPFSGVTQ